MRSARRPSSQRLATQALTLLPEGAMQLRPTLRCLEVLVHQRRSIGWLSDMVDEAGRRAGAVLAAADWSAARRLILSCDELCMRGLAWLPTVDTRRHAMVSG
jgi:hypothetical protein